MRKKHQSTLIVNDKEVFRGSWAECNKELLRILAQKGVYTFQSKFYDQNGNQIDASLQKGTVNMKGLQIQRLSDAKKKSHEESL